MSIATIYRTNPNRAYDEFASSLADPGCSLVASCAALDQLNSEALNTEGRIGPNSIGLGNRLLDRLSPEGHGITDKTTLKVLSLIYTQGFFNLEDFERYTILHPSHKEIVKEITVQPLTGELKLLSRLGTLTQIRQRIKTDPPLEIEGPAQESCFTALYNYFVSWIQSIINCFSWSS